MKKLILSLTVLTLTAGGVQADLTLGTDYPPGTPLVMNAGTTSAPMLLSVVSDNAPNDVMAAWNVLLEILPEAGATGTMTFQDPASSLSSPLPPNYIFGTTDLGLTVTNPAQPSPPPELGANDFFDPSAGFGATVPGMPGASLLQMDFQASSDASGLFGVYAVQGTAFTSWTDSNFNTQVFTNVPDGSGQVQIGEVLIIAQSVPEPSSLGLLGLAVILTGWRYGRQAKSSSALALHTWLPLSWVTDQKRCSEDRYN